MAELDPGHAENISNLKRRARRARRVRRRAARPQPDVFVKAGCSGVARLVGVH